MQKIDFEGILNSDSDYARMIKLHPGYESMVAIFSDEAEGAFGFFKTLDKKDAMLGLKEMAYVMFQQGIDEPETGMEEEDVALRVAVFGLTVLDKLETHWGVEVARSLGIEPEGYDENGKPYYDIEVASQAFNISIDDAMEKLKDVDGALIDIPDISPTKH